MKKIELFDLNRQYLSIKNEVDQAISSIISSSTFISGEDNQKFDIEFAKYCNAGYSIGVSSGTAALFLVLKALGISKDDEVILPSHTFAATAEAVVNLGATPVFVDVDPKTYNLEPSLVEAAITKKTRAVLAVHLYGQQANMSKLSKIALKYKLILIEDAAQAHGSLHRGHPVGFYSDAACFSFYPAKNLGCFGDGGAAITDNKKLANQISMLKDHGRTSKYYHEIVGYGERLDNLQAAILRIKLKHLDEWNSRRREIADFYNRELSAFYITPHVSSGSVSVYYVYTLRHESRDDVIKNLTKKQISTGIYYPTPLHRQPAFKHFAPKNKLTNTDQIVKEIFSIPVYPELEDAEVEYIATSLVKIAKSI